MAETPLFPRLLIQLAERRFTGHLEVWAEDVRAGIYFASGVPVSAERGRIGDTLGRLLVRLGKIDEDQYRHAIEVMTERLVHDESVRLGEVLVQLGIIGPEQVVEALRVQVREKILACFEWESVDHTLKEGDELLAGVARFECPVDAVVLDGIATRYDSERIERLLRPHEHAYPALLRAPGDLAVRFRFSAQEQRFVSSIDGKKSLLSLMRPERLELGATRRVLFTCYVAGALELRDAPRLSKPPPPSAEASRRPVSNAPSPTLPRKRGRELLAPASPIPAVRWAPPQPSPRRGEGAVGETPRPMARTQPQATGNERLDRISAEQCFHRGLSHLTRGELKVALYELGLAAQLLPSEREYELMCVWVSFMLASDDSQRLAARARSKQLAFSVLRQHQTHAKAHYILGHLCRLDGDELGAEQHFRASHDADPKDLDAKREVMRFRKRRR